MLAGMALLCGIVFVSYGLRQVAAAAEPGWLVVVILPGGLVLMLLGVLGVLIPGYI